MGRGGFKRERGLLVLSWCLDHLGLLCASGVYLGMAALCEPMEELLWGTGLCE